MRRTITLLIPLALLALLPLASCDDGRMNAAEFRDRARQTADRWRGSSADRAWREGFVPLRPLEVDRRQMPDWAIVSAMNGAWELATGLPAASPSPARLRWPDGSTLTVGLITAATAYAQLSMPDEVPDADCPAAGCRPLRVTAVELGRTPVPTSRGMVDVPAWRFTVADVPARVSVLAVDPAAITPRPTPEDGLEEVTSFKTAAGDPRRMRLHYGHGQCDTVHGAHVYESAEVVVVDVDTESSGGMCTAMLVLGEITAILDEPVGDRIVLDAESGLPVLPAALAPR
ncbi:hypothetical protein HS041_28530 [Planomonospora sp. ID67723]|uniref:hypothetical protein n=1 Tax=Planomonospora sp. ID67723 TaxID=2738134 RepID=UPI0018C3525C|nr:hypothetical protein [Planomonospora sp. ID67723]MBG0831680.1 hypothetical protein [Planomonospora sp. ID67723]